MASGATQAARPLTAIEAARLYADALISVVPVLADGSKMPACKWKEFQSRIMTPAEIDRAFLDGLGVAIIAGKVSDNLEIIDFDRPGLFDPFAEQVEPIHPGLIARLPRVATPRGAEHLYLRCDEIGGNQKLALRPGEELDAEGRPKPETIIETRGEGGFVLAPGCPFECNPKGQPYCHIGGPPIAETPFISPEERNTLLSVARSFHEIIEQAPEPKPERHRPADRQGLLPGDEFNRRGSFNDLLTSAGWKFLWASGGRNYWQRPGKSGRGASATTGNTSADGIELFTVFSSNAHPFQGPTADGISTSYSKFSVYAMLNHGGDHSAAAKDLYAKGFGERRSSSPARDESEAAPSDLAEPTPLVGPHNGNGHASNGAARKQPEKPKGVKYRIMTSAEFFAAKFDVEYLIEDILVAGQPCIVGGAQKVLKTSIAVDAAIALASGGYFLGKFPVTRPCRVLIMSGESGQATLQDTGRRICRQAGYPPEAMERLLWSEDLPQFGSIEHEEALKETIDEFQVEVVLVDPAYLAMPGCDPSNLFAQGSLLRGMAEACRSCRAMMILLHHTKNRAAASQFEPPELGDLAWAGFQEFARQWLLIGRREKYVPGTGDSKLWLSAGGSAGHSSLWAVDIAEGVRRKDEDRKWEVSVNSPTEASENRRREAELKRLREAEQRAHSNEIKLWDALKQYPEGETFSIIRQTARLNPKNADPALDALLTKGLAERCEVKKNKRTEVGYKPALDHGRTRSNK